MEPQPDTGKIRESDPALVRSTGMKKHRGGRRHLA
jgi:hypothetical protein